MQTGTPYIASARWGGGKFSNAKPDSIQFPGHISGQNSGKQLKMQNSDDEDDGSGTAIVTREKAKLKKPSLYRVLLLNDDFTPMHFVIHVLQRFFAMNEEQATQITLHVHNKGVGECGVFTYEVAETKVTKVMNFARDSQHPLQCIMEKK